MGVVASILFLLVALCVLAGVVLVAAACLGARADRVNRRGCRTVRGLFRSGGLERIK